MKTHIEIDHTVLEQICKLGGFATKKAAVNTALAECNFSITRLWPFWMVLSGRSQLIEHCFPGGWRK